MTSEVSHTAGKWQSPTRTQTKSIAPRTHPCLGLFPQSLQLPPLWRKGESGLSIPDLCSPTWAGEAAKHRPPPAADVDCKNQASSCPSPLSGVVRVGAEMSQAGKGALSQKQAGLTASTFPEACDLLWGLWGLCLDGRASKCRLCR